MKVTIRYEYDPTYPSNPCWAKADGLIAGGLTWEEARKRIVERLRDKAKRERMDLQVQPEDEEIEL